MAGSDARHGASAQQRLALDAKSRGGSDLERGDIGAGLLEDLRGRLSEIAHVDGCPEAATAAILALAAPPYYTPCPNPYLKTFLEDRLAADHRVPEALAVDISHVRAGPVYNAHSYPTKVPPEAIAQCILHYTEPNDVVLDLFAGTGMTGVAAQMCANPPAKLRKASASASRQRWGVRRAVLCDLSPLATFIAACLNLDVDPDRFAAAAQDLLGQVSEELGWMYVVRHGESEGVLNYLIWSELLACPNCTEQIQFWSNAVDREKGGILRSFPCPHCGSSVSKSELQRVTETVFDRVLQKPVEQIVRRPALLNYTWNGKRYERVPTPEDMEVIDRASRLPLSQRIPLKKMMSRDGAWGDLYRSGYHTGISHVHHFYFARSLAVLGRLWELADDAPKDMARVLKFFISSYNVTHSTLMTRLIYKKGSEKPVLTGYQTGVLYISSLPVEKNILLGLRDAKLEPLKSAFSYFRRTPGSVAISTQSAASVDIPPGSVDYVFVDPPFGDNIQYAEGNFIAEAWLGCFTNQRPEAVVSRSQGKDVEDYRALMERGFRRAFEALKPGRWMTVQFHNSQNKIWNAVQEAILGAGFVVADVSTLDKKQGSFKQVTTRGAVKQDLIISAYRPDVAVQERFDLERGSEAGVWSFVEGHLEKVASPRLVNGDIELVPERMRHLLFSRMVAFHVLRGVSVPMDASRFYSGLVERYPERDEMFFLTDQVSQYDRLRSKASSVQQLSLFVSDEMTAIQWLQGELAIKPRSYQDLHPAFMQALQGWERHERSVELRDLLQENFLHYDGAVPVRRCWGRRSD